MPFAGFFLNKLVGDWQNGVKVILSALLVVLIFPYTQQIMRYYNPACSYISIEDKQANKLEANLVWQLTISHLSIIVYIFIFSVVSMSQFSEFISNA